MIAAMASRADCEGPSGFSLESMTTASAACGLRREAAASIGSVVMRKAAAADAATDRCRKERREKRGMRHLHEEGVYQRDADGKWSDWGKGAVLSFNLFTSTSARCTFLRSLRRHS